MPDPPSTTGARPWTRTERLDAYQREHPSVGLPLAVIYKAFDDRAPYLAALVTYYAFVSLFPLLLLFVSVMGFILQAHPHLRQDVVNSAVGNIPGIGALLRQNITGFKGSTSGIVVGVIGILYGGLGAMQASQFAFNHIYGVPRNEQPNPLRSRKRSLGLLAILGTAIIVSSGINILLSTSNELSGRLDVGVKVLAYILSWALSVGLFTAAFELLTAADLRVRHVLRGGLITGTAWDLLQALPSRFVLSDAQHGSALYGVFGVVLATFAWIYVVAIVLMFSAELNVVISRKLWPRSLMSPFTDALEPTQADLEVYASYVRAQRFKGFEHILVTFTRRPQDNTSDRAEPPAAEQKPDVKVTPPV